MLEPCNSAGDICFNPTSNRMLVTVESLSNVVVRWERKTKFWEGFLMFGIIRFWIGRLSG
jgi:hypothetical protein